MEAVASPGGNGVPSTADSERASRPHDIERLLRETGPHAHAAGVFVDHTGRPTWLQQAWAGIPTTNRPPWRVGPRRALRWVSAGPTPGHAAPIEVAVAPDPSYCRPPRLPGVKWVARLAERVQPSAAPPRLRVEEAALDIAMREPSDLADRILADVRQSRRTTARAHPLLPWTRGPGRAGGLVRVRPEDIADGTCSTLERAYLDRVERAHAPPRPPAAPGRARVGVPQRDVDYLFC